MKKIRVEQHTSTNTNTTNLTQNQGEFDAANILFTKSQQEKWKKKKLELNYKKTRAAEK